MKEEEEQGDVETDQHPDKEEKFLRTTETS